MTDVLSAALEYAARGWRVIPIKPGAKHPPIPQWQNEATTDPATITAWWSGSYAGHGVGIATGPGSGVFVLDVDDMDALADLEAKYDKLPDTLTSLTGSGGAHLVFRWPDDVDIRNDQSGRIAEGIDVRGDGGQIVAPPSVHPNGSPYCWDLDTDEVAGAPAWLLELVAPPDPDPEPQPAQAPNPDAGDRPGDRWAAATDWAEILEPDGWTLSHVDRRTGERHWTRPGKDTRDGSSATTGYTEFDTLKVFTSSMAHAGLHADDVLTKLGYLAATKFGGDHGAAARWLGTQGFGTPPDSADDLAALIGTATPATQEDAPAHPLAEYALDWDTAWTTDHTAADWLLEPLFAAQRAHAMYAGAKVGKSWFVLAGCAALATGRPFLGYPGGEPVDVLYVDYEMTPDDVMSRLLAFGYSQADDLSHLTYAVLPSLPPLDTPAGGQALLTSAQAVGARFVVIDTMGRAVEGDENESSTYQEFYVHTGLPLKRAGIGWIRLDHAGKDDSKGQRGSSAKNDDVDIVMKLSRTEAGLTITATHRRVGWYPEKTQVVVAEGDDGVTTFRIAGATAGYVTGAFDLADKLDELNVPLEWGRVKVRQVLIANDIPATNAVLGDAIRWRNAKNLRGVEELLIQSEKRSGESSERSESHPLGAVHGAVDQTPEIAGSERAPERFGAFSSVMPERSASLRSGMRSGHPGADIEEPSTDAGDETDGDDW
jgi:hypothetical protein